jgi:Tfp pilus assembly protein PilX
MGIAQSEKMTMLRHQKGVSLIAAIFIIVVLAFMGSVFAPLTGAAL